MEDSLSDLLIYFVDKNIVVSILCIKLRSWKLHITYDVIFTERISKAISLLDREFYDDGFRMLNISIGH